MWGDSTNRRRASSVPARSDPIDTAIGSTGPMNSICVRCQPGPGTLTVGRVSW